MNERIRELAIRADLPFTNPSGMMSALAKKSQEQIYEKFAQLIVQECIEVSQVGSITADKLKQHFGVGE